MSGRGRRERKRLGPAAIASVVLHIGAIALAASAGMGAVEQPAFKVYEVSIVSPPPNVAGEPPAEPPAPSPGPAAAEPAAPEPPAPEPKPEPPRPAPPTPAPPRPTPPKPEPRREPTPPRETPRETPRPSGTEKASERPRNTNTTAQRTDTTASRRPASNVTARSEGEGTRPTPATGRNPDPNSPGGEGLTINRAGMRCPSEGYCENIVRQVRRYFRRPAGQAGSAEACFRILADGGVDRISVQNVRGSVTFRLAVQEAVEQAGLRKAFGELPEAFGAETLPVCVDITPQM